MFLCVYCAYVCIWVVSFCYAQFAMHVSAGLQLLLMNTTSLVGVIDSSGKVDNSCADVT